MNSRVKIALKEKGELGITLPAAYALMVKLWIMDLLQTSGGNVCHLCGCAITTHHDLSILNIVDWQSHNDHEKVAFDPLHLRCVHIKCRKQQSKNTRLGSFNSASKELLGMAPQNAVRKSHRVFLYHLLRNSALNVCYICDHHVEYNAMHIDHKLPWRGQFNAKELYFDVSNLRCTHGGCNMKMARHPDKLYNSYVEKRLASKLRRRDTIARMSPLELIDFRLLEKAQRTKWLSSKDSSYIEDKRHRSKLAQRRYRAKKLSLLDKELIQ